MTDALETTFANVTTEDGPDRRRRWKVADPALGRLMPRQETTVEALELAARAAHEENRLRHARALEDLREGLIARLPPRDAARAEADAEAVLSALARVARPGPRVLTRPEITDEVFEALRGPFRLRILYMDPTSEPRIIEPHGLLSGPRSYLVARQPGRSTELLNFRLDRILEAHCLDESFPISPGFSLADYSARAFGAFQDPAQVGPVVWRFAPHAANRAAEFLFHPRQETERTEDGSLIVRFEAAGWLEMAWHLYQWGDAVEILAPEGLRAMVAGFQRTDFAAFP